jgi:DNA-binding NarL/FixJ family response regulator
VIRILIADDHAIVREGLARILADAPDMTVVAQAATGPEVLDAARASNPDVVLLDISMPGRGGLETLKDLKRLKAGLKVLILSMHPEDQYAVRFLKDGADGYMTKESASDQLITAIHKVHRGGKFISMHLAERIAESLGSPTEAKPHETLSDREFQVMTLIAQGKTITEISEELYLSVKTVSTYRTRILLKLGLKNNAQIMRYAFREGLVERP